jgi:sporulation protein YlmC with PRC-barrel domain
MRSIALSMALAVPLLFSGVAGLEAAQQKSEKSVRAPYQQVDDLDKMQSWRGSKLIGSTVKDRAGRDIGKIEDLMFGRDGKISYAILSFGGLLGVGDRYYVVPWSSMRIERPDGKTMTVMLDNVKKEDLEKAPKYTEKAARQEPPPAKATEARSDTMITADVKTKLAKEKLGTLTKVDVDTKDGVVHLTGTVDNEGMKTRATEVVRDVKGVREVRNDLRVGS